MGRLILGVFVVLLINLEVNAQLPFSLVNVQSVITWGQKIFVFASEIHSWVDDADLTEENNITNVLNEVEKISIQLTSIASNIDQKLDKISFKLMKNSRNHILQLQKFSLNNLLNTIERMFDKSSELKLNKNYSNKTLKSFAHFVLWGDSNNIPNVLSQISEIIIPTRYHVQKPFLKLVIDDAKENVEYECNSKMSAQQQLYYILTSIIIAEMKGFYTISFAYAIQKFYDRTSNYTIELQNARDGFQQRLEDHYKHITGAIRQLPPEIHRCDVNPSKRAIDFFEMEGFARAGIFNIRELTSGVYISGIRSPGYCSITCSQADDRIGPDLISSGNVIYNCKDFGRSVTVCRAPSHSRRQYMWWKNEHGTYGDDDVDCNYREDKSSFYEEKTNLDFTPQNMCHTCMCSLDLDDNPYNSPYEYTLARIDVQPQVSDMENNMVVTGVQFVVKRNAVFLQIQQNKFSTGAIPINNNSSWKDPDEHYSPTHPHLQRIAMANRFEGPFVLTHEYKKIFLDDIILPDNYVVTGVKFERTLESKSLRLVILGTPFDLNTGLLKYNHSSWFYFNNYDAELREREEIDLSAADDPTKCSTYNYDQGTHRLITFQHSDLRKDAGQTTVPFFDAQPVDTQPAFPLSGIGLFHRGRDGFGGYIAPRIFTYNVHRNMKITLNNVVNASLN